MRTNGSPCHLLVRLIFLPQASIVVRFKQVPPVGAHISAGAHLGMEAQVGATTPITSSMIYRTGARHLHLSSCSLLLTLTAHLLALARIDTMLWIALITTAILPPGKHGTITLHIQSLLSSLLHTSQFPQVCAPAVAVLLLIEGISSCRKYPGIGSVSPHVHLRENPRLILKPLSPPL
jgi:hypothetical protein